MIAHLIGIDLHAYNEYTGGRATDYSAHQAIINEGIVLLNKSIASLNTDTDSSSPWHLDTIHYHFQNRVIHKYFKMYDGLHPTPKLKRVWIRKLLEAICRNLGYFFE